MVYYFVNFTKRSNFMSKKKAAVAENAATAEKKYMKPSEIATFGIGLFGVALLTGWMPDYTMTFFADFAFKVGSLRHRGLRQRFRRRCR